MKNGPNELEYARGVLAAEAQAVSALAARLDDTFIRAVDIIHSCADAGGSLLVSGLGKSGLVGAKISATFASLGIPSHAVHPSEAAHGDLGRFRSTDVALCLSFSGETTEVVNLAAILRQDGLPIISITRGFGADGRLPTLDAIATVALHLGPLAEAGAPDYIAPTCSTTATMALGDALALAVARRRNFTQKDFAKRHPGGTLGNELRPITDILRFKSGAGGNCPLIPLSVSVAQALQIAAQTPSRRPGALLIVDDRGVLAGIFTDGDLRRLVLREPAGLERPMHEVMTRSPRTIADTAVVADAVRMVREFRQDEIPVVNAEGRPIGVLDVQDLVTLKLVAD
ncbi:MAG: KpsF/GutQ family sugar-phosphate isomerase [Phycisphaeraceae bacterium]|nr:KpsF/GutQ family sugar-phosphate isomerase [Phycisphaeraceae bacterium]MCW5753172.1 KpsF/GutQ family sugar-phosphate isomerase [Phycisphaeraceae bacterium]